MGEQSPSLRKGEIMKIKFDLKKTLTKLAEKLLESLLKKVQKEDENTTDTAE